MGHCKDSKLHLCIIRQDFCPLYLCVDYIYLYFLTKERSSLVLLSNINHICIKYAKYMDIKYVFYCYAIKIFMCFLKHFLNDLFSLCGIG